MAHRLNRASRKARNARLARPLGLVVVTGTALALFAADRLPWQATAQEAIVPPPLEAGSGAQPLIAEAAANALAPAAAHAFPRPAPRDVGSAPFIMAQVGGDATANNREPAETAPSAQALAIPAGAAATAPGAGIAVDNGAFVVHVDHAKVVRLPERTQTVIVGNPIIADVTVQRNGILVVTGKSFGTTNMIALDGAGALLAESMISVQAPQDSVVTVQRGLNRESYSCTPTCQPSLQLGDNPGFFDGVGAQATQRNELATRR